MKKLAESVKGPGKVYFTGGATALLLGFREQTLDIDLKLEPEPDGAFEAIAVLKDQLNINVELASPDDFVPAPVRWRERSTLIVSIGKVDFYHFDFTLQALAKLERGNRQDLKDVMAFVNGDYTTVEKLQTTFVEIEPKLLRYPAIDPADFRSKLDSFLKSIGGHNG
jgi:hypothetical protein